MSGSHYEVIQISAIYIDAAEEASTVIAELPRRYRTTHRSSLPLTALDSFRLSMIDSCYAINTGEWPESLRKVSGSFQKNIYIKNFADRAAFK